MTITSVGQVGPVYGGNTKTTPASKPAKGDSVNISPEALEKAEQLRISEMIDAAPDVRAERVAELKKKINDPNYINEAVMRGTAEAIMDSLFPDSAGTVL
jgi:negative regulator of flagellin synthesis FlgM